ncbi:hypothetical protein [Neisseria sp. Ec49-e6-T10]|uniref:hypothetical protein n=1 Tax=Neisseria sp. Ec49-e6-T10 TaxID=3140744 RepID=UPI003EB7D411
MAACLSDSDLVVLGQISYTNKKTLIWQIDRKNPYTANNVFNDLVLKYSNNCQLIDDKLDLDFSVYALAYYPYKDVGTFEKDDNRMRVLLDRLRLSYTVSDSVRLDVGKLRSKGGIFYLKSPASLLNNHYSGFKPTRIYDPTMKQAYTESFWGAMLARDTDSHSLSLTVAPKLTHIDKRYESSSNWSATKRSNASDRYLFTYTDYRFNSHTPSISVMLGDSKSIAFSNSFNWSDQFVINAELAYHFNQQWRHLDAKKVEMVQHYTFPTQLYSKNNNDGVELGLGMQYTTNRFSQLGLEYYFQSEGYSTSQWRKQTDLVKFLNQKTNYMPLDQAFDSYKYLMASEVYNTSSKGNLQGKHYINAYANILMEDQSSLQPYAVLNLMDKSSMIGLHYNKPLYQLDKQLEVYTGVYAALGSNDSEFGLFGETIGTYLGFKYHF